MIWQYKSESVTMLLTISCWIIADIIIIVVVQTGFSFNKCWSHALIRIIAEMQRRNIYKLTYFIACQCLNMPKRKCVIYTNSNKIHIWKLRETVIFILLSEWKYQTNPFKMCLIFFIKYRMLPRTEFFRMSVHIGEPCSIYFFFF